MYPLCFLPFCLPQGPLHMNCVYIVSNSGYSQSAFTVALTRNVCVEWILGSLTENVLKCTLLSNVDRICPDMFLDHYTFKELEFYQSLEQLQLMLTCQTNPVLLDSCVMRTAVSRWSTLLIPFCENRTWLLLSWHDSYALFMEPHKYHRHINKQCQIFIFSLTMIKSLLQ